MIMRQKRKKRRNCFERTWSFNSSFMKKYKDRETLKPKWRLHKRDEPFKASLSHSLTSNGGRWCTARLHKKFCFSCIFTVLIAEEIIVFPMLLTTSYRPAVILTSSGHGYAWPQPHVCIFYQSINAHVCLSVIELPFLNQWFNCQLTVLGWLLKLNAKSFEYSLLGTVCYKSQTPCVTSNILSLIWGSCFDRGFDFELNAGPLWMTKLFLEITPCSAGSK